MPEGDTSNWQSRLFDKLDAMKDASAARDIEFAKLSKDVEALEKYVDTHEADRKKGRTWLFVTIGGLLIKEVWSVLFP